MTDYPSMTTLHAAAPLFQYLYVAGPTDDNADIPSLLGRDILNDWRTSQIDVDHGAIGFTAPRH